MVHRMADVNRRIDVRGWDAAVRTIRNRIEELRRERDAFRQAHREVQSALMDLSRMAQDAGPEYDRVSATLYAMARNLDPHDPYTTSLSNQLNEADAEYRRIRVASSMSRLAAAWGRVIVP
jgi:ABC-type transporter Mla subunit MlaD